MKLKPQVPEGMLADVIAPHLKVLFCGLNPGLQTAIMGHHFHGKSNRFWRVLHLAGFTPELIGASEDRALLAHGCGLTAVVPRATRTSAEVTRDEYLVAGEALREKVRHYSPRYAAFLGKAAYLALSGQRHVAWGRQDAPFAGALAWILPNPSGLNRGFSLEGLVEAYALLRTAIEVDHSSDR